MVGCWGRLRNCSIRKNLVAGVALLLIVDILWVGSAGLTKYLFTGDYNKPLFTVYFKTTLFSIYLVAFVFWRPWQRLCCKSDSRWNRRCTQCTSNTDTDSQLLLGESECDINEQTGQCEHHPEDSAEGERDRREEEEGKEEEEWKGGERRYFQVPNSSRNVDTCPLEPEHKTCLLGPPEYKPLGCYEVDEDSEPEKTKPLPPCRTKCCRVRFKPTVEIRVAQGSSSFTIQPAELKGDDGGKRHMKLLPVSKVALLSLIFGIVWFFANYLYALALANSSVAAVNTLSSMSSVFVMVLAAIPVLHISEGDRFTLSRLLVTLLSVGGAVMVGLSHSQSNEEDPSSEFNTGALYALGGAVLYAIYLVLLRKLVAEPESLDIPMFFGFVGLFDAVLLLPLVVIWHFTGIEPFEVPSNSVWTLLLVNGFIGTVLSELFWLWGVFLTSPLLGTLNLSLVTPLSIAYSIVVGKADISAMFIVGAVFIVLAFIGVTILEHYGAWDPVWAAIKSAFASAKGIAIQSGFYSLSAESQRLITREETQYINDVH